MSVCKKVGGYAQWPCDLDKDHEGFHKDALGRDFADEDRIPVIDPAKITYRHAERAAAEAGGYEDEGDMTIEGVKVTWWADSENVWFYNPGDDGENTIARFGVERTVEVWRRS